MQQTTQQHVLIVEDSTLLALDLQDALEQQGLHVVGPAQNLETAKKLIDSQHIDAALLDIDLGGVKSFSLAESLRARGIPFAFLTGFDQLQSLPAEFRADPFLKTPCDEKKLRAEVGKLLGASRN